MKFILGTKENMVQYFSEQGRSYPATFINAGPVVVTQLKSKEKDGYVAVQVGFGVQKKERLSKPVLGHLKDIGAFKNLKEFRIESSTLNIGDKIDASAFQKGDVVEIS